MAKKSRRARKQTTRKVSRAPVAASAPAAPGTVVESVADPQEYAYVVADIRQVAILAAAMFVLLIGLSFFIG
jgi:hypothetical protein